MTLLLTLYLGFQSSELHQADLALREYQDLTGERLPEKIYLAWKAYHYDHPLNAKGPQLAQLDGYQKLVDDAKRLYQKRGALRKLLLNAQPIRYRPSLLEDSGPESGRAQGLTPGARSSVLGAGRLQRRLQYTAAPCTAGSGSANTCSGPVPAKTNANDCRFCWLKASAANAAAATSTS